MSIATGVLLVMEKYTNPKDKNSLLYWYPKISDLGIPTPETKIVLLSDRERKEYLFGEDDWFNTSRLEKKVEKVIKEEFKLPIFMRTDYYSGKHSWNKTCYVDNLGKLSKNLFELVVESKMADVMGAGLPLNAVVVRGFIPMDSKFTAFFGEMPVNPERRYFIRDGKVLCHHPYWIKEAIQKGTSKPLPENWGGIVDEINIESKEEIKILTGYSKGVADVLDGFWSVDFCKARDGRWVLIDCAEGNKSWHPNHTNS